MIGVTGNIAAGKSTVDAMLAAKGALVIDADRIVHDVERKAEPAWQAIVDRFGGDILGADGELDRAKLGHLVFGDPIALRDLELIVHPAVRLAVRRRLDEALAGSVVVIDAVKLIESGMAGACDSVWVVTAAPEQQFQRLLSQRAMATESAWQRIRAQAPQREKVAQADVVIDNGGSLGVTQHQVDAAWQRTAGTFRHKPTL